MASPFKQAEFDIIYGVGISREGSLLDFGVDQEIVKKSGAWYTYEGEQLGQGKENSRGYLIANPEVANEIEKKIKQKLGIGVPKAVADLPAEETEVAVEEAPAKTPKAASAVWNTIRSPDSMPDSPRPKCFRKSRPTTR
jgi:recombination protein RecA